MAPEHDLLFSKPALIKWRRNRASSKERLKKGRVVIMKRMARLGRARDANIEGKVRALKKLVPNCEYVGVEGLFRETADYIMALQTRVRLMQIMVDLLSADDDH